MFKKLGHIATSPNSPITSKKISIQTPKGAPPKKKKRDKTSALENIVYHFFRQLDTAGFRGFKLMELFSSCFLFFFFAFLLLVVFVSPPLCPCCHHFQPPDFLDPIWIQGEVIFYPPNVGLVTFTTFEKVTWVFTHHPLKKKSPSTQNCQVLGGFVKIHSLKLTARTWKWMIGRLVSFWDGLFSGAMLVSGRVLTTWNCTGLASTQATKKVVHDPKLWS